MEQVPEVRAAKEALDLARSDLARAEKLRAGGAVTNVTLKSGTNNFHGSLFEFFRNSALDARNYFANPDFDQPPFRLNQYGGSLGGPIVKNRTFFFANWESTRFVRGSTVQASVPTAAMRAGDFSGLFDSQGRQTHIYDPMTTDPVTYQRQQFAYQGVPNTIDPARISPVAQFIFDHYQLPTRPEVNPLVDDNFFGPFSRLLDQNTYNGRIDHRLLVTFLTGRGL